MWGSSMVEQVSSLFMFQALPPATAAHTGEIGRRKEGEEEKEEEILPKIETFKQICI